MAIFNNTTYVYRRSHPIQARFRWDKYRFRFLCYMHKSSLVLSHHIVSSWLLERKGDDATRNNQCLPSVGRCGLRK